MVGTAVLGADGTAVLRTEYGPKYWDWQTSPMNAR
jgi:hypothetical protein